MKLADTYPATAAFGLLAAAFTRQPQGPANGALPPVDPVGVGAQPAAAGRRSRPGWFERMGEWMFRRQIGVTRLYRRTSDDIFSQLDTWLWKQQMRETESWLAQSRDVYDLEARIRNLERHRSGNLL
jgi:hypothetical protein